MFMQSVHRASRPHGFFFYYSAHLAGILSKRFASFDTVCFGHRSGALLVRSLSAKYRPDRYRRDKSVKFGTELP